MEGPHNAELAVDVVRGEDAIGTFGTKDEGDIERDVRAGNTEVDADRVVARSGWHAAQVDDLDGRGRGQAARKVRGETGSPVHQVSPASDWWSSVARCSQVYQGSEPPLKRRQPW